jgi:hypothetical protein
MNNAVSCGRILNTSLDEAEGAHRQIYQHHVPLVHLLRDLGMPLLKAIRTAAEFALNSRLRHEFGSEELDLDRVRNLLAEARAADVVLDFTTLEFTLRVTVERLFERFSKHPRNQVLLEQVEAIVGQARSLPFEVAMWTAQNVWSQMRRTAFDEFAQRDEQGEPDARARIEHFKALGEKLAVRVST